MNSICFFSSYFNSPCIPYYVKIYLEELSNHFSEVVLLTNEKQIRNADLEYLEERKIKLRLYKNKGYDFGMWSKAFNEFPVTDYDRIGLINDSCILFKKLDFIFEWINKNDLDYCGITDSNARSYHIQSYFLIINKKAIQPSVDYFKMHKELSDIKDVIHQYEIGLSSHLIKMRLKLGAYFSKRDYHGEYSPVLYFADKLINEGLPMIKKKIIFSSFRKNEYLNLMRMKFNINPHHYIRLIKKVNRGKLLLDFNKVLSDLNGGELQFKIIKFKIKSFFFQIVRKFKIK